MALSLAQISTVEGANSSPPSLMAYQGFLTDANGNALASSTPANYTVIFRVYSASTGGTLLWSEQQVATIDKGNFSVLLGQGTAYNTEVRPDLPTVFNTTDASDRYVELSVFINGTGSSATTISPRLRLVTSPYAMLANTAFQIAGNSFTASETFTAGASITGGTFTSSVDLSMPNNTVNAFSVTGKGTVPVGSVMLWAGNTTQIPTGWHICDGTAGTPNLQGRFVIGAGTDSSGGTWTSGASGGAASVTLTASNLPPHTHDYQDIYFSENNGTNAGYAGSNKTDSDNNPFGYQLARTTGTGNGLNSTAFSIIPPYYALYYIMRIN